MSAAVIIPPPVTHDALENAKRRCELLRAECARTGAFSYSYEQEHSLQLAVKELSENYKSAKRNRRRVLTIAAAHRFRLGLHELCTGSDTPAFAISLVFMVLTTSVAFAISVFSNASAGVAALLIAISALLSLGLMTIFLAMLPVDVARAE